MMKLGSFYGITAPMMVFLADLSGMSFIRNMIGKMNNSVDNHNLLVAKEELEYFKKNLDKITPLVRSDFDIDLLKKYDDLVYWDKGSVSAANADECVMDVKHYFVTEAAKAIVKESNIKKIIIDIFPEIINEDTVRKFMIQKADNFLEEKTFTLGELSKYSRQFNRTFLKHIPLESSKSCYDVLKSSLSSAFGIYLDIPEEIIVNNEKIKLDENERKIINYFKEHRNIIDELQICLSFKAAANDAVFSLTFRDIIHRKPERLYYEIINLFNPVKDTKTSLQLIGVRDAAIKQLEIFNKHFRENVTDYRNYNLVKMDIDTAVNIVQGVIGNNTPLDEQIKQGVIEVSELDEQTLQLLAQAVIEIDGLNMKNLNDVLGINCNYNDWNNIITKLCTIGLCGVNFYNLKLFYNSLAELTLNLYTKVRLDKNTQERFLFVVEEIRAMLESIRPIGGDLNERLVHF